MYVCIYIYIYIHFTSTYRSVSRAIKSVTLEITKAVASKPPAPAFRHDWACACSHRQVLFRSCQNCPPWSCDHLQIKWTEHNPSCGWHCPTGQIILGLLYNLKTCNRSLQGTTAVSTLFQERHRVSRCNQSMSLQHISFRPVPKMSSHLRSHG